ncbi:MAG: hypothetical protein GTO63_06345 [Anaerolineae bacterium]|nr:hypothetical protein [Anaerolineae bacterium]NIN94592.1 hypothetical protein [Anaerolineae bacterium]NIQ77653.1 hypothetical protein [Anaerolineae bacterium]
MKEGAPNGTADSSGVFVVKQADEHGGAVRNFLIVATLIGLIVGGFVFLDSRAEAKVDKHAERPHTDAVSVEQHDKDIERIEKKLDKLDEKLDRVLEKVSK